MEPSTSWHASFPPFINGTSLFSQTPSHITMPCHPNPIPEDSNNNFNFQRNDVYSSSHMGLSTTRRSIPLYQEYSATDGTAQQHQIRKRALPQDEASELSSLSYGKLRVLENQMANMGLSTTPGDSSYNSAYSATEGTAQRLQAMYDGRPMGPSILQPPPTFSSAASATATISPTAPNVSSIEIPYSFNQYSSHIQPQFIFSGDSDSERKAKLQVTPNYFVDEPVSDEGNELVSPLEHDFSLNPPWTAQTDAIMEESNEEESEGEGVVEDEVNHLKISDLILNSIEKSQQRGGDNLLPEAILNALRPSPSRQLAIVPFIPYEDIIRKRMMKSSNESSKADKNAEDKEKIPSRDMEIDSSFEFSSAGSMEECYSTHISEAEME